MLEEGAIHDILCSALVDDCIERAKSIKKQGGAVRRYRSSGRYRKHRQQPRRREKLVFEQGVIGQQQLAALADDTTN